MLPFRGVWVRITVFGLAHKLSFVRPSGDLFVQGVWGAQAPVGTIRGVFPLGTYKVIKSKLLGGI